MECSGEKGLNKGRIHNNDTISLFSFSKDRLDMGRKRKYTTFRGNTHVIVVKKWQRT